MADVWSNMTNGAVHTGSWGLPDFGITEAVGKLVGAKPTSQGGSNLVNTPSVSPSLNIDPNLKLNSTPASNGSVLGLASKQASAPTGGTPPATTPATPTGGGGSKGTWSDSANTGTVNGQTFNDKNEWLKAGGVIDQLGAGQQDAAAQAAEASRQAAARKYDAQAQIAAGAKGDAKDQFDWLINTLGSNKQDLLSQVTQNENSTTQDYQLQETKTKAGYDKAKQDILNTYRDLNTSQEKIMRGSGMSTSSRSMEASMRLNNLMGKDLSQVTTNEADSIALIGKALTDFKAKTDQTRNTIETQTKSSLDKAALDYNSQIKNIDNNLMLSANEREDAYAAAEVKLAEDTQKIKSWTASTKTTMEQQQAQLKMQFDEYVLAMTDAKGGLNTSLADKTSATNTLLKGMGYTPLDTETGVTAPTSGAKQASAKKYNSLDEINQALQSGQISALEADQQKSALQTGSSGTVASAATPSAGTAQNYMSSVKNDPLLNAIYGMTG